MAIGRGNCPHNRARDFRKDRRDYCGGISRLRCCIWSRTRAQFATPGRFCGRASSLPCTRAHTRSNLKKCCRICAATSGRAPCGSSRAADSSRFRPGPPCRLGGCRNGRWRFGNLGCRVCASFWGPCELLSWRRISAFRREGESWAPEWWCWIWAIPLRRIWAPWRGRRRHNPRDLAHSSRSRSSCHLSPGAFERRAGGCTSLSSCHLRRRGGITHAHGQLNAHLGLTRSILLTHP